MRLVSLSSGSSGNAIYVGTDNTHILIDVGISAKKIEEGLSSIDIGLEDLTAIVITHEHIDHIRSLGIMLRKRQIPIYATKGTLDAIDDMNNLGKMPDIDRHIVISENDIDIGDISLHPFKVDHDAKEPVAYRMTSDGKSIAVATDMGHYTDDTIRNLSGLDAALIESNHDIHMLEVGPYPFYLKRRIL